MSKRPNSVVSGNIYGLGGGFASYSGSGMTTTYGTQTTYIPYNERRYDYYATYWIKRDIEGLPIGATLVELPKEIRQKMGSNKGLLLLAVIKNGPFYMADIISGDVLLKIGDKDTYSKDAFETIDSYKGNEVDVVIWREGKNNNKKSQTW